MKNSLKITGYVCLSVGLFLLIVLVYRNSQFGTVPRPYSSYTLVASTWDKYKTEFLNSDGRIIDYSNHSVTTSEGQSYALLRAVWMDDKTIFDRIWKWTEVNMKRKTDHLFGWRWGQRSDGNYGFLSDGGDNSASDADTDIALALILAGRRWNMKDYYSQAGPILADIWDSETASAGGNRYLTAGNWAHIGNTLIINPSYFSPYAWRIFSRVDPGHDWLSLVTPAYDILNRVTAEPLDRPSSANLPPDWFQIDTSTLAVSAPSLPNLTTNYSFDAIRIPWRIALDYLWNKDDRAKRYLSEHFRILAENLHRNGKLASAYTHDGTVVSAEESPAIYAAFLGYYLVMDKPEADRLFQEKIISLYSNDTNSFNPKIGYYDQNWLWFGMAMYTNTLIPFQ